MFYRKVIHNCAYVSTRESVGYRRLTCFGDFYLLLLVRGRESRRIAPDEDRAGEGHHSGQEESDPPSPDPQRMIRVQVRVEIVSAQVDVDLQQTSAEQISDGGTHNEKCLEKYS